MFRKSAYEKVGGYRPEYEPAEDLDLWMRLAEVGAVANLPEVLLKYRVHPHSTTATRSRVMREKTILITLEGCRRRGIPSTLDDGAKRWAVVNRATVRLRMPEVWLAGHGSSGSIEQLGSMLGGSLA